MIRLKEVTIHKYKSIENRQVFDVEHDVTVLVGMNESGKTSVLEALAKSNYFRDDAAFRFSTTHDYPRREKKRADKLAESPLAISCVFSLSAATRETINADVGAKVCDAETVEIGVKYDNAQEWTEFEVDPLPVYEEMLAGIDDAPALMSDVKAIRTTQAFDTFLKDERVASAPTDLENYRRFFENKWGWKEPVAEYVARVVLAPRMPKFLYYDEYYSLPSRISIEKLQSGKLDAEELKTAMALFELADINTDDLLHSADFEDYKAELEATQAVISEELFKYWSTNKNLEIEFDIERKIAAAPNNTRVVEHILDVRVRNNRTRASLPLRNRSKGFNWFFSFLVWFMRIQEDQDSQYIILLDEPGLNLHASAQSDLLKFIESLTGKYQVLYTTHSPFMVRSGSLHRVRTVLETGKGTVVSDSVQEKDPNTLFPLQAALGYDVAQNLYLSSKNLLVEGSSDLVYLQTVSAVLEEAGRVGLRDDVTIVPVGGLEKVATFISLLRGSKLEVACLLDSSPDQATHARLNRLIVDKIIRRQKILFYDTFVDGVQEADVEDLFTRKDYLRIFNAAFHEYPEIELAQLDASRPRIVVQLAGILKRPRFNHFRPANALARRGLSPSQLDEESLSRFEAAFEAVNGLFG